MGLECSKVGKESPKTNKQMKEKENEKEKEKVIPHISLDSNIKIQKENFVVKYKKNPTEFYEVIKELGSGTYGTVSLVKNRLTEVQCAMKTICKEKKVKKSIQEESDKAIMNEVEILKNLDHPNIVKVYEFYTTEEFYYIITECCAGGELYSQLEKCAPFDEFHAAFIMFQIFNAVYYCHLKKVMHRDLKPENVLIDKMNKDNYFIVKVIDFGTAKLFKKEQIRKSIIGSPYYIAPEVLNRKYNEKCDLWSCGVIFYILLSGKLPFDGVDEKEIFEKITSGIYQMNIPEFEKVSPEAKDLIKRLLVLDPEKRIKIIDIFNHRFFVNKNMKDYICGLSRDKVLNCLQNIKNYQSEYILQTTVIAFLVHNFTHHDSVKDANIFFNIFDNGIDIADGKLTREEVVKGLAKFMTKSDVIKCADSIFKKIDVDCNGYIEYEEFIGACIDKQLFLNPNILQFAFNFFDKDRSGKIDLSELAEVFCSGSGRKNDTVIRDSLKNVIQSIDINGDGCIDLKEFTLMMNKIININ